MRRIFCIFILLIATSNTHQIESPMQQQLQQEQQ
jgi:hypothetical protein